MFSMRWPIVMLIFRREVRDQLRDRRTLFMIFVLPILLYPLLGLGLAQLSLAFETKARTVVVVGPEFLPPEPPLLTAAGDRFDPALFEVPAEANQYTVLGAAASTDWGGPARRQEALRSRQVDVIVVIPKEVRAQIADESASFQPELVYDSGDEQSRATARAVREVFARWSERIVGDRLRRDAKPRTYLQPVQPRTVDVARVKGAGGNPWARLFPFLLVMMSLTGAFYPAIDLCAGEKERGTMETLLISPASRAEIVMGKFLTVVLASMATALLNLASMGLTALQLSHQLGAVARGPDAPPVMTAPSLASAGWMVVMLVPLSIFFSALCIALAAMARSMKEGQYYLTPLYLVALPLIFVTLAPGIELNLFMSLVPVTGVSLLLRALMLEHYREARLYFLPVLLPLLVYGALALRWAVDQFRRETVLFREAERFDLRAWLVHIVRDRGETPTGGQALLCFALMLAAAWYSMSFQGMSVPSLVAGQLAFILAPTLILTFLLTSSPRRTLRLSWPEGRYLALGVILPLALNPLANELRVLVEWAFPLSQAAQAVLKQVMGTLPDLATAFVALALVPPICEELAFRGFILSGLEREYSRPTAIVLSAFLFGFLHVLLSLFHQLFNATLLGMVLALLAIRSGSILPGILFHIINNALAIALGSVTSGQGGGAVASWLFRRPSEGLYHGAWVALGGVVSLVLIARLARRPRAGPGEVVLPPPAIATSGSLVEEAEVP
jgi:sodium transport system permease protein